MIASATSSCRSFEVSTVRSAAWTYRGCADPEHRRKGLARLLGLQERPGFAARNAFEKRLFIGGQVNDRAEKLEPFDVVRAQDDPATGDKDQLAIWHS